MDHHLLSISDYYSADNLQVDTTSKEAFFCDSSFDSNDSGICLLTEENLAFVQHQLGVGNFNMSKTPKPRNITYTSKAYDQALKKRDCIFNPDDKDPSNRTEILEALDQTRSDSMTSTSAKRILKTLRGMTSETMVSLIANGKVIDNLDVQEATEDRWACTNLAWRKNLPLPAHPNPEEPLHYIGPPNPDTTIGFSMEVFKDINKAFKHLDTQCFPVGGDPRIIFPVFTIEEIGQAKEEHGRRQSLHNAAVMLRDLRTLWKESGMAKDTLRTEFDGVAHVMTLQFTATLIQLCGCWTEVSTEGFSTTPSLMRLSTHQMVPRTSRRSSTRSENALDWVITHNKGTIEKRLTELQGILRERKLAPLVPAYSVVGSTIDDGTDNGAVGV
ncbi:hypothetical protein CC86DRAFT_462634 [Ophiobolus disseminans]|uniref:DUF7924 domain-containing protein n=1 Tax=Ophiobolus disseminans TaxID=1469910 RepID=A0A6A7AGA4_9PLEO|nr:hypothetical protein CC86DRAFT_462634 [Ophiobolus disseminans]